MMSDTEATVDRQQLRKRLLHDRMNRILSTDIEWIEDLGDVQTRWCQNVEGVIRFRNDRFHGFYKYRQSSRQRQAVVKYTGRGIYELSRTMVEGQPVIEYTRIRAGRTPGIRTTEANLKDFVRFLRSFS